MERPSTLCLWLLVALLGGGAGLRAAAADDSKEARKDFREASKAAAWQDRRDAYLTIADYDGAEVVKDVLGAMARETNPAVVLTGIRILSGFRSQAAQEQFVSEVRKGKGVRKMHVLMALARQQGDAAVPLLLEVVKGKDGPAAAQAALALGRRGVEQAVPLLVALLAHSNWQLRRAGAMALRTIAQPPPPKPKPGEEARSKDFKWPVPEFMEAPEITRALVAALAASKGVERGAILAALESIHETSYGFNLAAWKLVAAGEEVGARVARKRLQPPYAFQIPLYGQRIVLIYDNSLRAGDPHRFGSGARLLELCMVPGGERPILASRLLTVGQFARAHYVRSIRDMMPGQKFELITFNETVRPLFGKFTTPGGASRKLVAELFANIQEDNGIAAFDALTEALDMGGAADSKAWKRGPDEIVFVTCNQPTAGAIKDADVVGAAIALKARLRMVPIHTIGIESHPYSMLGTIAKETGGTYRNLYE